MKAKLVAVAVVGLFFAGCETNVAYRPADFSGDKVYKKGASPGPQLKENEVLGLRASEKLSDEEIQRVLDETRSVQVRSGSTILLVQSGAADPDKEMVDELSNHFTVVPHTGIPSEIRSDSDDISKALRLAAAQSKAETIVVYWGKLELKRDDLVTSIVSWVPVIDFTVPDEYQKVRMHLKLALIDVRNGNWATFRTEPIESESLTTRYAREREQKWLLESEKRRLYQTSVRTLVGGYVVARN